MSETKREFGYAPVAKGGESCFVAYFFFVGWDCLSLGAHICLSEPNLEIHVPFGFLRVGWQTTTQGEGRP